MKREDVISKIDGLIKGPVYLIDIFPDTVPSKPDNRYFKIKEKPGQNSCPGIFLIKEPF